MKKKKQIFKYLLFLLFVTVTVFSCYNLFYGPSTYSEFTENIDVWDGNTISNEFSYGNGTKENPYQILSGADFALFQKVISESNNYNDKYFILEKNLDMNNYSFSVIGTEKYYFKGNFNGNGYMISNLNIDTSVKVDSINYHSLFFKTSGAVISNLNIYNEKISNLTDDTDYVSLLVGESLDTTITNVSINSSSFELENAASIDQFGGVISKTSGKSNISNIVYNLTVNTNISINMGLFVNEIADSDSTFNNIIYHVAYSGVLSENNNLYLKNSNNIKFTNTYQYETSPSLTFKDITIDEVLDNLNQDNTTYEWFIEDNQFYIKDNIVTSTDSSTNTISKFSRTAIVEHESSIDSDNVYINELDSDYQYYMGLNYSYGENDGYIPDGSNQKMYSDTNLVKVFIKYSSLDVNDSSIYSTVSLEETQKNYYYYKYYPVTNNSVTIELISNPFTNLPEDKAFNGWVTDYSGVTINNTSYGTKTITIPVTYTNNVPDPIEISFNTSYVPATISEYTDNENWDTIFSKLKDEKMQLLDTSSLAGMSAAATYKKVSVGNGSSLSGYYDENGVYQNNTSCNNTDGCTYYEYMNYYDHSGNINTFNENSEYYYLPNKDTNIILVKNNITSSWSNQNTKPFTLTSVYNDQDYRDQYSINLNRFHMNCYNDIKIQNVKMNGGNYNSTDYVLDGSDKHRGYIYANNNNIILGRGITSDSGKVSVKGVIGASNENLGQSYNPYKYQLQIESGKYNSIAVVNGTNSTDYEYYLESRGIFGSDYDKVAGNNDNLIVYSSVTGSLSGTIGYLYSSTPSIYTVYKSGTFGKNNYTNKSGIFIGSINTKQNHYAKAVVEGGDIYQIVGGNSSSQRQNYNSSYIYIKGGTTNIVALGDTQETSYGNRVGQITSGTVTHALIMGGLGSNNLSGSSFAYIGGKANIGGSASNVVSYYNGAFGSIYGSGYGTDANSITTTGNSTLILDNGVKVLGNVYGGGNNTSSTSKSNILLDIRSANISGNVFGSSLNGNLTGNTTINVNNDTTISGSVYGGNDQSGILTGDVLINFNSGTITKSLYGGGNLGYESSDNQGTFVDGNITINIGTKDTTPVIKESLFGAGKYGSVHKIDSTEENTNETKITMTNGIINGSLYGGSYGDEDLNPSIYGNVTIDVNGGNIGNLYGGCNQNGTMYGVITVNLSGGIVGDAYGGSYQSDIEESHINLVGGTVNNLFGGSNQNGTAKITNVFVRDGTVTNVYGGNNVGGKSLKTNVTVTSKNVYGTIYNPTINGNVYGGGRLSDSIEANLTLQDTTQEISIYGGGEEANVEITNLIATGSNVDNVFGGSATSGNVGTSNVRVENGVYTNIYGGNDMGGKTKVTNIVTVGGTTTNLYGGGNYTETDETNVEVIDGIVANLYGGGNRAGAGTTNVSIISGSVFNAYGGSDHAGNVENANISTSENAKVIDSGVTFDVTYEAYNTTWESQDYPTIVHIKYKINNNSGSTIKAFNASVYAEKSTLFSNYSQSEITENDSFYSINEKNRYWGTNEIPNNSSYEIEFYILTHQPKDTFKLSYGLSSSDGENQFVSGSSIMVGNLYGGNNEGGYTENTNVIINSGFTGDIYGGGDIADVGYTNVTINGGKINGVYGGSNNSTALYDTNILTTGGVIITDMYGGGNEGVVEGNTSVEVRNTQVNGNVYAGGNGEAAVVKTSTSVIIDGTTTIGESVPEKVTSGCVFGGGRVAEVGEATSNDGKTNVSILGGTIYKNVYGGANTSVIHGTTDVKVGSGDSEYKDNIHIYGTVFGGGEANAEGSETYDYTYISVTKGITIRVDGKDYKETNKQINIDGSVFGSGNASSSSGTSEITISNYGNKSDIKPLLSIQRTQKTTIDNSWIEISGTTDRTNEFSTIKYSLNRIDLLELKNNAHLFLQQNANLLKSLSSVDKDSEKATVTIDDEEKTVTKNTDNRIYILANKGLNVAVNQAATSYGTVSGMTFLGMYKKTSAGENSYGLYDLDYSYGSSFSASSIMTNSAYVLGLHATNHDTTKDGFYTNEISEESNIKQAYIKPTPADQDYYLWNVGLDAINYTVNLTASKYSSLGTYELSMKNFATGDTKFNVLGFNSEDLNSGVELVDYNEVPKLSNSEEEANSILGLSMKAETSGWTSYGTTKFLSEDNGKITGTKSYKTDSQAQAPSFMFYLYHAKDISLDEELGSVVITIQAMVPTNEVEYEIKLITVTVNIDAKSFDVGDCYDASISYDKKYEMPSLTSVNITNKSSFTTYYSLYATTNSYTNYYGSGNDYYHAITSSYALPVGTSITMLDYGGNQKEPTYYYYTVDEENYSNALAELASDNQVTYKLSDFIKMGSNSTNNTYNEQEAHNQYYSYDYTAGKGTVLEEFIFIVDLKDTSLTGEYLNNSILFELRNSEDRAIVSVLGMRQQDMKFNLYESSNLFLQGTASMLDNHIYKGNYNNVSYKTKVLYNKTENSENIIDTNYESVSMGVNISFLDSSGNQVSSANLQDTVIKIDGVSYLVDSDGIYRIKLSDKVSMLNKNITIKSEKSLAVGTYTMRFTLFSSNDGLHNSIGNKDFSNDLEVVVVGDDNLIYAEANKKTQLIEKSTSTNANNQKINSYNIHYRSLLENPNIRISLSKRNISSSSDRSYSDVDLSELFNYNFMDYSNNLSPKNAYQKLISVSPQAENELNLPISNTLKTGTYKLEFELYDGNHLVDTDIKYIIVKNSIEKEKEN